MGCGNPGGRRKVRGMVGRDLEDQLGGVAMWVVESQGREFRGEKQ